MVLEGYQRCEICNHTISEDYIENGKCRSCRDTVQTVTIVAKDQYGDGQYVVITCNCDDPHIEFERQWSDGMAKHNWYKCRNCEMYASVGVTIGGRITHEPWKLLEQGENINDRQD